MRIHISLILFSIIIVTLTFCSSEHHQHDGAERSNYDSPSLVVGIIVDGMRPDFIHRYWDKLSDDGFKRMINQGFTFTNNHFEYRPTATGPGHASVFSGTTPSVHGIMGNSWYVRELDRSINTIEISGYEGVGTLPDYNGSKGPSNMLSTTVGDELRLHTNNRSRVIGISFKDRAAILMAGHTGDAYWFEGSSGNFVTSTFYRDELPTWLQDFNDRKLVEEYLSKPWETLLPIDEYIESSDDNTYKRLFDGQEDARFPQNLPKLVEEHNHEPLLVQFTPFGDELLLDLTLATIEGESLGQGDKTDILAISFSSPDGINHRRGPASIEVQDTYLRLDLQIARLLEYLDEEFGKENILVFLTSDHGMAHIPNYMTDQGIPGGHFDTSKKLDKLRAYLMEIYGEDFLLAFTNLDIFLDHQFIDRNNLDHREVQEKVARFMLSLEGVAGALTRESLNSGEFNSGIRNRIQNGFHQKRSGDVMVWLEPQTTSGTNILGTTHGSPWVYDTHAPMYWYGFNIPNGQTSYPVSISDIAPTLAVFLNSPFPSGTTGQPMNYLIK